MQKWARFQNLQIAALAVALALGAATIFGSPPGWLSFVAFGFYALTVLIASRYGEGSGGAADHETAVTIAGKSTERKIIDGLDSAVVLCTGGGVVRLANVAARELFMARALVGMNLRHVALSEDLAEIISDALRSQTKSPISKEFAIDYPQPRSLRVRALKVGEDEVALVIADVSDLRRLETIRRDFVANVSHELRTPMASIRAIAETIEQDTELTADQRVAYLDKIIAEVDRLTLLSEDLLTLATAEARPAEQTEIDLAKIARYAVQQMEQHAATKGLTLTIDAPPTQPALGDAQQVIQVAINLLQNAIRYTNIGGATVRVYEDSENAIMEVSDTGIGIGKEHLPRIFERFYRVDAARSRDTGGTGLGLAIVRHITEGLGGRVEVESEPGSGSVFRVRLPL